MKKLLALLFASTLLSGCAEANPEVTEVEAGTGSRFNGATIDMNIITDTKTGCKYIYIDKGALDSRIVSITPLMETSTTVDCNK